MAREIDLSGSWWLSGCKDDLGEVPIGPLEAHVPGHVMDALAQAGLVSSAQSGEADRAREWVARRSWHYAREFEMPNEPQEGRSEKYEMRVRALGAGVALLDGVELGRFDGPWQLCAWDVTRLLEGGGHHRLTLRIERGPQGEGAVPSAGVMQVCVHAVSFARIEGVQIAPKAGAFAVKLSLQGYGAGRIKCKYRLLLGDKLVATQDVQCKLIADRQVFEHEIPVDDPRAWQPGAGKEHAVYTLRLSVERGGTRCDLWQGACAFTDFSLEMLAGGALPYALHSGGQPLFIRGVNVLPPISDAAMEALADAGVNLVRFHGPLPPQESTLALCDALGLLIWQEVPPCTGAARDAAARLAAHPAGALFSAGHDMAGADGLPMTPSHPLAHQIRQAALEANAALTVLPSSPAGPVGHPQAEDFGRGLCQDVHGPLALGQGSYAAMNQNDAALLSKVGFPAPQGADAWPQAAGGPYAREMEALCGPFGEEDAQLFAKMGAHIQWGALRYALLSARRREGTGCVGALGWCANAAGASEITHALIGADGRHRPALAALKEAYAPCVVSARMKACSLVRGEDPRIDIMLSPCQGEERLYSVQATLCDLRGGIVEEGLWQMRGQIRSQLCGKISAPLPEDAPDVLLLRLQVSLQEAVLMRGDYILTLPRAGEAPLAPLRRLPATVLSVAQEGAGVQVRNDNAQAAVGAAVYAGAQLLYYGALFPWESKYLALPDGVLAQSVSVQTLNPAP